MLLVLPIAVAAIGDNGLIDAFCKFDKASSNRPKQEEADHAHDEFTHSTPITLHYKQCNNDDKAVAEGLKDRS